MGTPALLTRSCCLLLCASLPLLLGAAGGSCGTTQSYRIDRTALVPVPAPDPSVGPPAGPVDLTVADEAVLWASAPRLSTGSTAGLYVPRHQPAGTLRVPLSSHVHLRGVFEVMPASGAIPVPAGRLELGPSTGLVFGTGVGGSGYVSRRVWLTASADLLVAAVPSVISTTCLTCGAGGQAPTMDTDTGYVPVLRAQFGAGLDLGRWRLSASLAGRNHPVNVATMQLKSSWTPEPDAEVSMGPLMLIPSLAVAFRPIPEISIAATAFAPLDVTNGAVHYAPVVGLSLSGALPGDAPPPRRPVVSDDDDAPPMRR